MHYKRRMLGAMSNRIPPDLDDEVIDVGPLSRPQRRRWKRWVIIAVIPLLIVATRSLSIYLSALWFGSLGYAPVYWYMFRLKVELFVIFFLVTVLVLRGGFWLIQR